MNFTQNEKLNQVSVQSSLCQDLVGGTPGLRKIIFILSREGSNLGDFP